MVLLSGWLLMSIVDWDPVIAMSFGVCSVNSAGVVRTSAPVCRTMAGPAGT